MYECIYACMYACMLACIYVYMYACSEQWLIDFSEHVNTLSKRDAIHKVNSC
jgi:hypothetical protein